MYQEFFLHKGVLILPIVAMASFALAFAAILLWSMHATRKEQYDALAHLPLADGSAQKGAEPEVLS